ncbi:urease accessory protein [Adhaeribacter arboris]|uniref:Urease accessory protein UreD n=1 Tax=Adhaeribacter arboris TaxID=2072846 RepID=A0A2T2YGD0_9BACT|nr:urease accessory protein UreD [Adhaeribacter arboris]PSR54571.1 urease accessory protein [Adhaeribacter arboris]
MISELKITVAQRLRKSYLQQAYCTQPFKLAPVGEDKKDPTLYLMIRSSSPGVLDGDNYQLEINLNENCWLHLQTQSYQRLFRMEKGATQTMVINLAADSFLHFIPHPIVPHENSVFRSLNRIYMAEGASLIWGEIITCGRKLSGEIFKFTFLHNLTEVYRNGRIIFKDQLLLTPAKNPLQTLGQWEQFTHQGTLIYLPKSALESSLIDSIHDYLADKINLTGGVSQIAAHGLLIRLLGTSGEQLFQGLQEISSLLQTPVISKAEPVNFY